MTSSTTSPLLNTFSFLPEDPLQLQRELINNFTSIANAVNSRTIGSYETTEEYTGNSLFKPGQTDRSRDLYRLVVPFGAIAAGASLAVAHNISPSVSLKILGSAITSVGFIPLPYSSATLITDQVQVDVSATTVTITNGATANAITSALVVFEYIPT